METLSIAFFNNKGGVGKTTLTCNIAATAALDHHKRVLLIDLDPQCNSTQLVLGLEKCNQLYRRTAAGENGQDVRTIYDKLDPLIDGETTLDDNVKPLSCEDPEFGNRFGVDIYIGDPRLAMYEDHLASWWSMSSDPANIRKTNWMRLLLDQSSEYDLIFVDVGPSLGALNRSILMNVSHFVSPLGADTFSIMALDNIRVWIEGWKNTYESKLNELGDRRAKLVERYGVTESGDNPYFAGYTVQQYITKSKEGVRRPTIAYEQILEEIPAEVEKSLIEFSSEGVGKEALRLGDVPTLYSLVPLAQNAAAPIAALTSKDGLNGGQYGQQKDYRQLLASITSSLFRNLGIEEGADIG